MLLEFMVKNYMSFKDANTLSLIATKDNDKFDAQVANIDGKIRVLKNAAIFGANASGKSNFLQAVGFARDFVISSSKDSQQGDAIDYSPFLFSTATENAPSVFELTFLVDSIVYRYGFEVNEEKVINEWLFGRYSVRESLLFIRNFQEITLGTKFPEGKKYLNSVRENALFLSVCAQFNGKVSTSILEWFRNLNVITSLDTDYVDSTIKILKNKNDYYENQKKALINLITNIDVGIEDISVHEQKHELSNILDDMPVKFAKEFIDFIKNDSVASEELSNKIRFSSDVIKTVHSKYDEEKRIVGKSLYNFGIESSGTQKVFELAGPIINTLYSGGTLFIDEIQNSLHTKLLIGLISFFVHNNLNIKAQFIITTHDTNVLASNLYRRDQLWFVEKNRYGESELTCLADFEEHVRKDASIDKDYLRGRYGAIPYISLGDLYGNR